MRAKILGVVAAWALLAFVSNASAEVITETYTGYVTQGTDFNDIFGLSGQSLVDQTYTAAYTFDTSLGSGLVQIVPGTPAGGGYYPYYATTVYGGTATAYPASPLLSSSLTINGYSVEMGGSDFGQLLGGPQFPGSSSSQAYAFAESSDGTYLATYVPGSMPYSITTAFYVATTGGDGDLVFDNQIYADLSDITSVRLTIDTTPLPTTLPLFATGLGVMGLFGWRRKRKQVA